MPATVVEADPNYEPVTWYGMLRAPLEGALGALAAWCASIYLIDIRLPLTSADEVDVVVTAMLAAGIGAALMLGSLSRREVSLRAAVSTLLMSPLACIGTLLGVATIGRDPSVGAFVVSRVAAWSLVLAMLSLVVTAPHRRLRGERWVSAVALGGFAGVFAGLVYTLPGPSMMWQALAFLIAGIGVGTGAFSYPAWRVAVRASADVPVAS